MYSSTTAPNLSGHDPVSPESSSTHSNPRFECAIMDAKQKKRKFDKLPNVPTKRQKVTSPGALAVPIGGNSIRYELTCSFQVDPY